jgi:hypothetical protein
MRLNIKEEEKNNKRKKAFFFFDIWVYGLSYLSLKHVKNGDF